MSDKTSKEQTLSRIRALCTAYERGFGHGYAADGTRNPYQPFSEESLAYGFGREEGTRKLERSRVETPALPFPVRQRQAMQGDESYVLSNLHTAAFLLDRHSPPKAPARPRGKPCTCDNCLGSSVSCRVEAGERLGELWYCRKAAESQVKTGAEHG